jgi:hypothetical protein
MLLLRAAYLEFLVCFHVIGAAVLFRRFFPRESPWLGFFVPVLAVMFAFNFAEHYLAMPNLGWLLPVTLVGLLWGMVRPGYTWQGLRLPSILFVVIFTLALAVKCLNPAITCNTEGTADFARVLDFCLGDKLPPTDSWMPPYDHGAYYTFQHYGASLLTRLFSLDVGTGYNIGFVLLNTLTVMAGAGAAYAISGRRLWICLAATGILLANFTGSALVLLFLNPWNPDFRLSIDINEVWNDPKQNPFWQILAHVPNHPTLRLFTPTFNFYFPEFHANLGGHFMTLATLLFGHEACKNERSNWPWIGLVLLPVATIITSTWFFFIVLTFAVGALAAALLTGRRPQDWRFVLLGAAAGLVLIWPSVGYLLAAGSSQPFSITTPEGRTSFFVAALQWWPVYVPWLLLCFAWARLSLFARFLHLAFPVMLLVVEYVVIGDRGLTVEKIWGGIYGAGLVTFWPLVFLESGLAFRFVTVLIFFISSVFLFTWTHLSTGWTDWANGYLHLQGDSAIQVVPQKKRLLQVLKRLHGVTILPGKSDWSYNEAPSVIGFSENRCYVAWYNQEIQCGHAGEAEYRDKLNMAFYAGTLPYPLAFLQQNHIAAVLIWPDDQISDALLAQIQTEIGSDYFYVDCKGAGPNNAGVFMPRSLAAAATGPPP